MSLHIHPHAAECPRRQDALDGRAEKARHPFTPGPWRAWHEGKTVEVHAVRSREPFSKPVVKWVGFDGCNRPLKEQIANAYLIATAPDMVEELGRAQRRECASWCSPSINEHTSYCKRWTALLAKARGEA